MRWFVRENFHHLAQLRLDSTLITKRRQHPKALLVITTVRGLGFDHPIDFSQRASEILIAKRVVDEGIPQQYVIGPFRQHLVGLAPQVAAH